VIKAASSVDKQTNQPIDLAWPVAMLFMVSELKNRPTDKGTRLGFPGSAEEIGGVLRLLGRRRQTIADEVEPVELLKDLLRGRDRVSKRGCVRGCVRACVESDSTLYSSAVTLRATPSPNATLTGLITLR
jgi:hypothetical protein